VCDTLTRCAEHIPLVVDPVMVATTGARLLESDALTMLRRRLIPLAALITPNLPEAEALAGMAIPDVAAMHHAADALLTLGAPAVLLKGGHLPGEQVVDLLATVDGIELFATPRIASRHTHGTGCTLASAVAAGLAQRLALRDAVIRAREYVRAAITAAPGFGAGAGPLNHAVWLQSGG
jgi:hydroxymethylpyrimidine/phosphomethylpyrimidine kinase